MKRLCSLSVRRKRRRQFTVLHLLQDAGSESTKADDPDSKGSLNLSKVFPRPASSPVTSKHKRSSSDGMIIDEKTRTTSDSGVELTPVEKFNSSSEGSGSTTNGSRKAQSLELVAKLALTKTTHVLQAIFHPE